jgi:hypothetical protein
MDRSDMKRIIIFDDNENFLTRHRDKLSQAIPPQLKERFEIPEVKKEEFVEGVNELIARYKHFNASQEKIKGEEIDEFVEKPTCFDEAGILFVDYRLIELHLGFITGEEVAYFARAFSKCGLIVGLNQFSGGGRVFDLTLSGHPESFADLNISDADIENPGLWTDDNVGNGFRPWHWPNLPRAAESFEKRVSEVPDLNQPLFQFLEFTPDLVNSLPRAASDYLSKRHRADGLSETTFADFLSSGFCLRGNDTTIDAYKKRIIAARLGKWLDRFILGGQNTLVDAPHLVSRFPSLLGEEPSIQSLNALSGPKPPLSAVLEKYAFKKSNWLSRPAWFWEILKEDPAITEVSNPWERKDFPFCFCEDTSTFVACGEEREFVASVPSPFTRRFVKIVDGVEYVPELRFAL